MRRKHNPKDFKRARQLGFPRRCGGLGRLPAGLLLSALAAAGCKFDSDSNPARGCEACAPPNRCIAGFCVPGMEMQMPMPEPEVDSGAMPDAEPAPACQPGTSQLCYEGPENSDQHPPCRSGRKSCTPEGTYGECRGQITPISESCNDVDDDCDGLTDEQLMRDAQVCVAGKFVCQTPAVSVAELCDGADNDCDGKTDEGFYLAGDPQNCGGCGITCEEGESCCDGACSDTDSDARNCGACGMECLRNTTCCGGGCVDTSTDARHCGECGERCAGGMSCCDGACVDSQTDRDHCGPFCLNCAQGEACCFGSCADLDSFQHCGSCERACSEGELCCNQECSTGTCAP